MNNSTSGPSCDKDGTIDPVYLRCVLGGVGTAMCFAALIIMVCLKAYKRFTLRLAFYLNLAATLYSLVFALQAVSVLPKAKQSDAFCVTVSYFVTYTRWTNLLLLCAMTLHLFLLSIGLLQEGIKKLEWLILCLTVLVPVPIAGIPLITGSYGSTIAWCWIKSREKDGSPNDAGLAEQIGVWYAPFTILMTVSYIMNGVTVIAVYKQLKKAGVTMRRKRVLKEAIPLIVYPVLLQLLGCIGFANRIVQYSTDERSCDLTLWWISAAVSPLQPIVIAITFVTQIVMFRRKRREPTEASETAFPVSREFPSECEQLVIRGQQPPHKTYYSIHDTPLNGQRT